MSGHPPGDAEGVGDAALAVAVGLVHRRVDEPGASGKYSGIDKVPEQYRAQVKKLIANGEGSPVRFEFRKKESKDD